MVTTDLSDSDLSKRIALDSLVESGLTSSNPSRYLGFSRESGLVIFLIESGLDIFLVELELE